MKSAGLVVLVLLSGALAGCVGDSSSGVTGDSGARNGNEPFARTQSSEPDDSSPWHQARGNAQRHGIANIQSSSWDRIALLEVLEQPAGIDGPTIDEFGDLDFPAGETIEFRRGMGLLETPFGLIASVRDHVEDTCFFVQIDWNGTTNRTEGVPCAHEIALQGWDEGRQRIMACHVGGWDDPVLVSYDGDYQIDWYLTAREMTLPRDAATGSPLQLWTCSGAALLDNRWIVPVRTHGSASMPAEYGQASDSEIHATGPLLARLTQLFGDGEIVVEAVVQSFDTGIGVDPTLADEPFSPHTLTASASGYMMTGLAASETRAVYYRASEMMDWQADFAEVHVGEPGASNTAPPSDPSGGSAHAIMLNDRGAATLNNGVMHASFQSDAGADTWADLGIPRGLLGAREAPPVLVDGAAIFDVGGNLVRVIMRTGEAEILGRLGPANDPPSSVDLVAVGSTLIHFGVFPSGATVLDRETGRVLKWLSFPFHATDSVDFGGRVGDSGGAGPARFTPVAALDELWLWNAWGKILRLGAVDDDLRPDLRADTPFPRTGEAVNIDIIPGDGRVVDINVWWGDQDSSALGDSRTASHTYDDPGLREVWVQVTYADERTATSRISIDVGGRPEQVESWVATQFKQNPDASWGTIGLIVTALGAMIAVASIRLRRRRLRREIHSIERAADANKDSATDLAAAMRERRAHVRGMVLDGRIDEAQLRVLEHRIDELGRHHRMGSVGEKFDFLPHGFVRRLESMLADGRISSWEEQALGDLLDGDKSLTARQKADVRKTLRAWATADA